MWRKAKRLAPELIEVKDDIAEARKLREQTRTDMHEIQKQAKFVKQMTDAMIDRQGRNHYIETLYEHLPEGAA